MFHTNSSNKIDPTDRIHLVVGILGILILQIAESWCEAQRKGWITPRATSYNYFHNYHKEPCWTTHYSHWQLASTSVWAVWGYGGVCCLGGVRLFPSIFYCCQCPAELIGQRFRGSTSWRESRTHRKEAVLRLHVCRRFGLFNGSFTQRWTAGVNYNRA